MGVAAQIFNQTLRFWVRPFTKIGAKPVVRGELHVPRVRHHDVRHDASPQAGHAIGQRHGWHSTQFLEALGEQLERLDRAYGLTRSQNAELEQRWLELVIRTGYRPGYARLEEYLKSVGRRRLIMPLYVELMKTPAGGELAKRVYAVARPGLHPQTAAAIDAIVTPETAEGAE